MYKRQALSLSTQAMYLTRLLSLFANVLCLILIPVTESSQIVKDPLTATVLDVYKRQAIYSSLLDTMRYTIVQFCQFTAIPSVGGAN